MVSKSFEQLGLVHPFDSTGDHLAQRNLQPLLKNFAAKWADIMKSTDEMITSGAPDSPSSTSPLVTPGEGGKPGMHNCGPG